MNRIVGFAPELCETVDNYGNLPMHHLCQNTSSGRQDMLVMFSVMYEKNEKAILTKNARQQTPISILENRLCKVEDSYENPYETNRDAQSSLYEMMIKMKNA